jgi:hypothetical protein
LVEVRYLFRTVSALVTVVLLLKFFMIAAMRLLVAIRRVRHVVIVALTAIFICQSLTTFAVVNHVDQFRLLDSLRFPLAVYADRVETSAGRAHHRVARVIQAKFVAGASTAQNLFNLLRVLRGAIDNLCSFLPLLFKYLFSLLHFLAFLGHPRLKLALLNLVGARTKFVLTKLLR